MTIELVIDSKSTLGEGPSWDEKEKVLYWVDILQKKFYQYNPISKENKEVVVEQLVGAIAPKKDGGIILALQNGLYSYDFQQNMLKEIHNPEAHLPDNRFNDGKCDPAGRFWVGTMDIDAKKGAGSLYLLDQKYRISKKLENLTISNGITWSPDNRFMYFIDTPTRQVVRYDYDLLSGEIKDPKVVITLKEGTGDPDGMTIDQDGMLWVAQWGGYGISRWDPNQGKQIDFINVPAANVTSCSFGGEKLNDLYITTARIGTSEEDLEKYPHAGGLFKLKTNINGGATYQFNGEE
ncbi:SMP-30/gluconolactonase/LRE family protein [Metabacillus litoralis]|uniref:SMP-30/gluconolactonase/LRE family protein n=1 Tax=Metabacillus litoralis TaxID=152268 RepID=UPI001CFE0790|nr:SMP-30/gluconolactonase/LRE family protein [Metabacillus litoralis]